MDETQLAAIRQLSEPLLAQYDTELVELAVHRRGGQWFLRLLVDKIGGVTIQDCTRLNQALGQVLDTSGVLDASYTLEVSSPGLDRPLASRRDFERAVGEQIQLQVADEAQVVRQITGQLLAVQPEPEALVVKTSSGNVTVPLSRVRRASKAIRW